MRVSFIGDIMLGRKVGETIEREGAQYVFGGVEKYFQNSDYVIANLEAPFVTNGEAFRGKDPHLTFKVNPQLVSALARIRINVLTLANNHMTDFGQSGIEETRRVLEKHSISFTGAGQNFEDSARPVILPGKIGIFAFNAFIPFTKSSGFMRSGVAEFNYENVKSSLDKYYASLDSIILVIHWGVDYHSFPIPKLISMTTKLLDRFDKIGAVVGHHPHLIQPMIRVHKRKIYLSLGNFIFEEPFPLSKIGGVLHLDFDGKELISDNFQFVKFTDEYKLEPLTFEEEMNERNRLQEIEGKIKNLHRDYLHMDTKWIKLLTFLSVRYFSIRYINYLLKLYNISELIRKISNK